MEIIRTFFAIALPSDIQEMVHQIVKQLQQNKELMVKWVKPQHLHITLQFLKDVLLQDISLLINEVRQTVKNIPAFTMELNQLELFPNTSHPRFITMSLKANSILNTLVEGVGKGILRAHYPIETRPYRAHLTLGKLYQGIPHHFNFDEIKLSGLKKFDVNEIIFYQSIPAQTGSHYSLLARFFLNNSK